MTTPIGLKILMDNAQGLNWPVISIFGLIAAISFLIYAEPSPKDNKGTNDAHWPAHLDKANKPMKAINPINEKKVNGMNGKFHKESTKNANASTNANATENANVRENTQTSDDSDPSMKSYKASKISCYLVLDVEATCVQGKGYEWPNEIIEWPVILLRWIEDEDTGSIQLEVVDEFHSFVRPTYKPILDPFCTQLTGITQEQVDQAPTFPEVLELCKKFLIKNGIINSRGKALEKFAWATDGPWDLRDFLRKQLFISNLERPSWIPKQILDVRQAFGTWYTQDYLTKYSNGPRRHGAFRINPTYKLAKQLEILGMKFEGREHSGIDDSRNIARVVMALSTRGFPLQPNLDSSSERRFDWMGPHGTVIGNH